MAFSEVGSWISAGVQTGASQTLTYPTGIQADDLIIIVNQQDANSSGGFTVIPGYTVIRTLFDGTDNTTHGYHALMVQAKMADGTESGNFSYTGIPHSSEQTSHQVRVFRGPKLEDFETDYLPGTGGQTNTTIMPTPALTHSAGSQSEMLFFTTCTGDGNQHTAPPSTYGGLQGIGNLNGIRNASAYDFVIDGNSKGEVNWIASGNDRFYATTTAFLPSTEPPEATTGFDADPVGLSGHLTWNTQADADSWDIESAPDSGGSPGAFTLIASVDHPTLEYYNVGLEDGDKVWYRIRARNIGGVSSYSSEIMITVSPVGGALDTIFIGSTAIEVGSLKMGSADVSEVFLGGAKIWPLGGGGGGDLPATVVLTSALYDLGYDVRLTWPAATDAHNYRVYRSSTGAAPWTQIAIDLEALEYIDYALAVGTWSFYVTGVGIYGEGLPSNIESETVVVLEPDAPTSLVGTVDADDITLNWTAPAADPPWTSYTIYRGTASGVLSEIATGITGETYFDPGLTYDTTYYYEVTAVGPGGESVPSNEESVELLEIIEITGSLYLASTSGINHPVWNNSSGTSTSKPAGKDRMYVVVTATTGTSPIHYDVPTLNGVAMTVVKETQGSNSSIGIYYLVNNVTTNPELYMQISGGQGAGAIGAYELMVPEGVLPTFDWDETLTANQMPDWNMPLKTHPAGSYAMAAACANNTQQLGVNSPGVEDAYNQDSDRAHVSHAPLNGAGTTDYPWSQNASISYTGALAVSVTDATAP